MSFSSFAYISHGQIREPDVLLMQGQQTLLLQPISENPAGIYWHFKVARGQILAVQNENRTIINK